MTGFERVKAALEHKESDKIPFDPGGTMVCASAADAKALPNCGIAMAIDIGDAVDIHPRNKKEVGRRLALSALAITYGKDIEWSGVTKPTDQQVIYPPSVVPIVDMHTHMDAKTQYAKSVETMDQWGSTISITLAGILV